MHLGLLPHSVRSSNDRRSVGAYVHLPAHLLLHCTISCSYILFPFRALVVEVRSSTLHLTIPTSRYCRCHTICRSVFILNISRTLPVRSFSSFFALCHLISCSRLLSISALLAKKKNISFIHIRYRMDFTLSLFSCFAHVPYHHLYSHIPLLHGSGVLSTM